MAAFAEADILASQADSGTEEPWSVCNGSREFAARLEARPLLGAARGVRARLLAASGRATEAKEELTEAIALFASQK